MTLSIGGAAPLFEKRDQHGEPVRLADFRGDKAVVLYFYPKDETPGCTVQACKFRDDYEDFVAAGAVVIGVSQDNEATHRGFAENHRLPFLLISDDDGAMRKAYGVKKSLGVLPGRETFVIDREGVVQHRFRSQIMATKHVSEALAVVKRLR